MTTLATLDEFRRHCGFSDSLFDLILAHHSEPGRVYHTADHPADLLEKARPFLPLLPKPLVVIKTALIHDVVMRFGPGVRDNEEQSAAFAREHLAQDPDLEAVCTITLATKDHVPRLRTPEEAVFLDLDLSILSDPPEVFDRYDLEQIPQEYAWADPDAYRTKRAEVLAGFLERTDSIPNPLYRSPYFTHRAPQAKANLRRALLRMGVQPAA